MSEPTSPRQVIERLLDGISQQKWLELHELYAEDAVIEYPFALPSPMSLEGRDAVREYFAAVAKFPLELRARNIVIREMADPAVLVVQWDYDGLATTTQRTFQVANIQVTTVRDGLIVASQDYHNHALMAHSVGRLSAVVESLTQK